MIGYGHVKLILSLIIGGVVVVGLGRLNDGTQDHRPMDPGRSKHRRRPGTAVDGPWSVVGGEFFDTTCLRLLPTTCVV